MILWIRRNFLILITCLFTFGVLRLYYNNFDKTLSDDPQMWSSFGEFIGGSLGTFIGIVTVFLTYNIINNQLKDSEQTEFKYIFQLLFESIELKKGQAEYTMKNKSLSGSEAIIFITNDIQSLYTGSLNMFKSSGIDVPHKELIENAVSSVLEDIDYSTGPYMKTLHNCLKVIDSYCLEKHKKDYVNLIRNNMDDTDLVFVFYNCLASDEFKEFKERIEKFSFLKDINHSEFPEKLKELYSIRAFE